MKVENVKVKILPDGRLDTANAAAYLGLSKSLLETMRCQGCGPKYVRVGGKKIFYFKTDLDAWILNSP